MDLGWVKRQRDFCRLLHLSYRFLPELALAVHVLAVRSSCRLVSAGNGSCRKLELLEGSEWIGME